MIPLIGNSDVVVFRDPVARNPHTFRWWTERGLIRWEDQMTGEHGTQSVAVTLERMKGLNDMIGNSRLDKGYNRPDEVREYQSYIDAMLELCKKAHAQGRPDDPAHAKQLREQAVAKRQSRMVVLPGFNTRF